MEECSGLWRQRFPFGIIFSPEARFSRSSGKFLQNCIICRILSMDEVLLLLKRNPVNFNHYSAAVLALFGVMRRVSEEAGGAQGSRAAIGNPLMLFSARSPYYVCKSRSTCCQL
jgi:hypothetical protein